MAAPADGDRGVSSPHGGATRSLLYREGIFRICIAIARAIPRPICHPVARAIASLLLRCAPGAVAGLERNLALGLGLEGEPLARLVRRTFSMFGESVSDYFSAIAREPGWTMGLVERWEGAEHLEAARRGGRGALVVTAHFGSWELGGTVLAHHGIPLTVVTLQEPSAGLDRWRQEYRERHGIKTLILGRDQFAALEIVRALGRGEFVAMLVDRPSPGEGIEVPFLGRPTPFSSAPAMIWQHTGAPVLPAHVIRLPGGRYLSSIGAPVGFARGEDRRETLRENTAKLAAVFGETIGRHPEQWFNFAPVWEEEKPPAEGEKSLAAPPAP